MYRNIAYYTGKRIVSCIFLDVPFSGCNIYVQTCACSIFDGTTHCVLPNDEDTDSFGKIFRRERPDRPLVPT